MKKRGGKRVDGRAVKAECEVKKGGKAVEGEHVKEGGEEKGDIQGERCRGEEVEEGEEGDND